MAMLPATVCTRTFSTGVKGKLRCGDKVLKIPKPRSDAGIVMVLTQPVWRPKYMFEKLAKIWGQQLPSYSFLVAEG